MLLWSSCQSVQAPPPPGHLPPRPATSVSTSAGGGGRTHSGSGSGGASTEALQRAVRWDASRRRSVHHQAPSMPPPLLPRPPLRTVSDGHGRGGGGGGGGADDSRNRLGSNVSPLIGGLRDFFFGDDNEEEEEEEREATAEEDCNDDGDGDAHENGKNGGENGAAEDGQRSREHSTNGNHSPSQPPQHQESHLDLLPRASLSPRQPQQPQQVVHHRAYLADTGGGYTVGWVLDEESDTCMVCDAEFTLLASGAGSASSSSSSSAASSSATSSPFSFFGDRGRRRRHHCRQCGILVCAQCSPYRAAVAGLKGGRVVSQFISLSLCESIN